MLSISSTALSLGTSPGGSTALSLRPVQRLLAPPSPATDSSMQFSAVARDSFQFSAQTLLSQAAAREALGRQLVDTSGQLAAVLNEPATASGGELLRISGRREASVSIQTQDGDVVEISLRSAVSFSAGTATAVAGDTIASEATLSGSRQRALQVQVNGSLDADERKAIRKLLHRIDKAARKFFSGDLAKALHKLDKLKLKGDELASVAVDLSRQRTVDYAAALQLGGVGAAAGEGEAAQTGTAAPKPPVPITEFRRAPRPGSVATAAAPDSALDTTPNAVPRARVFAARPAPTPEPVTSANTSASDTRSSTAPVDNNVSTVPGSTTPALSAPEQIDLAGALRSFSGTLRIARTELPGFAAVTVVTELSLLLLTARAPADKASDAPASTDEHHDEHHDVLSGFGREFIAQLLELADAIVESDAVDESELQAEPRDEAIDGGPATDDDAEGHTESTRDDD